MHLSPLRVVEFLFRSFYLGGAEGQAWWSPPARSCRTATDVQVGTIAFRGPLSEQVARLGFAPRGIPARIIRAPSQNRWR